MYNPNNKLDFAISEENVPSFQKSKWVAAIKHLFRNKKMTPDMINDKPIRNLIDHTNEILQQAIDQTINTNVVPDEMSKKLKNDVFVFSGFKSYHSLKEASLLLQDENGQIKSFAQFKNEVEVIHQAYNEQYLNAEYIFAIHSSQAAAQWAQFEKDGDMFDLQYRTAGDEKVRASHARLNRVTLPINDPFWDAYMTPNGWRCRCKVIQVRKGKYPLSDSSEAIQAGKEATTDIGANGQNRAEMFRFNPGKQKVIFPKHHPYYAASCATCTKKSQLSAKIPVNELCNACKIIISLKEDRKKKVENIAGWINDAAVKHMPKGKTEIIGKVDDLVADYLGKQNIHLKSKEIVLSDKAITHMTRDTKPSAPDLTTIQNLEEFLIDSNVFFDETKRNLVFAKEMENSMYTKFVVELNYITKIDKKKKVVNFVVTGGNVSKINILNELKRIK